jgi:hypothetical protein
MTLEEDRLTLHDLRGVNLKVGSFLGTREEFLQNQKCVAYSVCWDFVNVRVDQVTITEQLHELDFHHLSHQLYIDDHKLSGEVCDFNCWQTDSGLIASCTMLLGRDY